jgi:hypothetical protein
MDLGEIGWPGSGQEHMVSSCECGNEPSGSIKRWETIEWLHNLWPSTSAQQHTVCLVKGYERKKSASCNVVLFSFRGTKESMKIA